LGLNTIQGDAQNIYTTSGGEIIFQSAMVETTIDNLNTKLRFSMAFHLGEFIHADFGKHVGIFSGIGLRNVGFITDQEDIKIKYRSYNMGIPLALKVGTFDRNFYFFGGAEYEWMIHFKQKTFIDDGKYKYSGWFSRRTPAFIPSAFAGFQFPGGVQIKFKYYLDSFLNHKFDGGEDNNYTLFKKTQVWYISLSYLIKNKKKAKADTDPANTFNL